MKPVSMILIAMVMLFSAFSCTDQGDKGIIAFYKSVNTLGGKKFEVFYTPGLVHQIPTCSCGDYNFHSLILRNLKKGNEITFSVIQATDPDRVELIIKQDISEYKVNSLQTPYEDAFVKLVHHGEIPSIEKLHVVTMK